MVRGYFFAIRSGNVETTIFRILDAVFRNTGCTLGNDFSHERRRPGTPKAGFVLQTVGNLSLDPAVRIESDYFEGIVSLINLPDDRRR